jgi:hypothetical protein
MSVGWIGFPHGLPILEQEVAGRVVMTHPWTAIWPDAVSSLGGL